MIIDLVAEADEEPSGCYVRYGDLTEEQKLEALALRPRWSDCVQFWVEDGHVFKCAMSAAKHKRLILLSPIPTKIAGQHL